MNIIKNASGKWDFDNPKTSEMIFLSCKTKTPVEFVGRVLRLFPSIKLAQLMDVTNRHFELTPQEYNRIEQDFIKFSNLKKVLVSTLLEESCGPRSFVNRFFRYSSSGGLNLAVSLATEVYHLNEDQAKKLSEQFSPVAYTKMASYQKGFKRTAALPMYDWNILDPIWELSEKDGSLVIIRKVP